MSKMNLKSSFKAFCEQNKFEVNTLSSCRVCKENKFYSCPFLYKSAAESAFNTKDVTEMNKWYLEENPVLWILDDDGDK